MNKVKTLTAFVVVLYVLTTVACSKDEKATLLIEPKFTDPAPTFSDGMILATSEKEWGYFDKTGQCELCFSGSEINAIWSFQEGLARFKQNDKYGFLDKQGKRVIPAMYKQARNFSEGLAAVRIDDRWGFIDKTGRFAIDPTFLTAHSFSNGRARVNLGGSKIGTIYRGQEAIDYVVRGGRNGYIDQTGKMIIKLQYDWALDFVGGYAKFNVGGDMDREGFIEGGKWGFIDKNGQQITEPTYDYLMSFNEGFAAIKADDKWGFIDGSGRVVIEPIYNKVCDFSEGLAVVQSEQGGRLGYIDSTGKFVIAPKFWSAGDFVEGLAPAFDGKMWGYIDKAGQWAIKPQFRDVEHFSEGFAIIHFSNISDSVKKTYYGLRCRYRSSRGGFKEVTEVSFIDKKGEKITTRRFEDAQGFSGGMAAVKVKGKWGFLGVKTMGR